MNNINPRYRKQVEQAISAIHDHRNVRVLFVCLGNICRSPAAEGMMLSILEQRNDTGWSIDSAGIGGWHIGQLPDSRMRQAAKLRGIDLVSRCRQVRETDFDDFDLIIGMDSSNIDDLKSLAPSVEAMARILPMAAFFSEESGYDCVPAPYYGGAEGFETVLNLLSESLTRLYCCVRR